MNGRNTLTVYLSGVAQQTPMSFSMGHLNGLQNEYFILFLKAYDEFIILQYTDANSKKTFLRKYENSNCISVSGQSCLHSYFSF